MVDSGELVTDAGDPRERDALHRVIGLANHSLRAGDLDLARRLLDRASGAGLDELAILLGRSRLAILQGDADAAIACLAEARRLDPFDEDAADLLGRILLQRGDWLGALECLVDSRILAASGDAERASDLAAQIDQACASAGLGPNERTILERERSARLEEIALETEDLLSEGAEAADDGGIAEAGDAADAVEAGGQRAAAASGPEPERPIRDVLRMVTPFSRLGDNELRLLECTMDRLRFAEGQTVFREGQPSEDLFVVESGRIVIQRETPFGNQVLATIGANGLFGEMNFIDGRSRSADAVTPDGAVLLRIAHESLRRIFDVEPALAFVFLEQFWRGLADKVREGNELMKSFFPDDGQSPPPAAPTPAAPAAQSGRAAGVANEQKASVLQEKGLSGEEMRVLSEFAEAMKFEAEQAIFREGDAGGVLFIVFEGRVRIEKHIPGVGQEALAILERGDFFGEMSVVDDSPRSASAIAHDPGTTVLAIRKTAIDRLLETRGAAAHSFLLILCRILSSRLREINDKIVQWRFMSGGF